MASISPTTSVRRSRVLFFTLLVVAGICFFGVRWELPSTLKDTSSEFYSKVSKYAPSGLSGANIVAMVKPKRPVDVDEIYGLLHFVTRGDEKQFGDDVDVTKALALDVYAQGESGVVWETVMQKLNEESPVFVFSKTYCPYSQRAKMLLNKYDIVPKPKIVEVDLRDDDASIKALLFRLTGRGTFPNVIVRGNSIGGSDDVQLLHAQGLLRGRLEAAGLTVQGSI